MMEITLKILIAITPILIVGMYLAASAVIPLEKIKEYVYIHTDSGELFVVPQKFSDKHLRLNVNIEYLGVL